MNVIATYTRIVTDKEKLTHRKSQREREKEREREINSQTDRHRKHHLKIKT